MSEQSTHAVREPSATIRLVAIVGGLAFLGLGLWALVAPRSFFDTLATFEPYNRHLLHDLGAFQAGLGAVLILAAFPRRIDGLAAALFGVGIGAALHVVSHILDVDLGGTPSTDIPSLSILALVLLIAGSVRARNAP